jgi:hypothetical protein
MLLGVVKNLMNILYKLKLIKHYQGDTPFNFAPKNNLHEMFLQIEQYITPHIRWANSRLHNSLSKYFIRVAKTFPICLPE